MHIAMHIFDRMENREMIALGWTLLHFCWQGTLLGILYAVADRMTRRAATRVRYGIALLTLILMPIAAIATFAEQQRLVAPLGETGQLITASQLGSMHTAIVTQIKFAAPLVEESEIWIAWNADRLLPWIDGLWLGGVFLLAIRSFGGWVRLERIRREATIPVPPEVRSNFLRMKQRLNVGHTAVLYLSAQVISPLAMGVWRTAVILPAAAVMQLTPEQIEAVFAHELAHIRRWDYLCNLMQVAVECLLFFHPAVWWISRRTRDLREICCDETATRSCVDPIVYAETLLRLEEQRVDTSRLVTAFQGRGGFLLNRVRQVLGEKIIMENKPASGMRLAIASAVIMALLIGPRVAEGLRSSINNYVASTGTVAKVSQSQAPAASSAKEHSSQTILRTEPSNSPVPPVPQPTLVASSNAIPEPAAIPVEASQDSKEKGSDYIDSMRAAGYPLDLNKDLDTLVSLRSLGVTPEYAREISQAGLGTPSLHDLISLKSLGVTSEYINALKSQPYAPENFHDVMSEKSLGITPEYAKAIGALNLGTPNLHDLISLKAQGITPEYAAEMKASGLVAKDLHELGSMKAVGVTPEYAKEMASIGFPNLSTHELISLRAQGVTPEYVRWVRQNFPNAQMHDLEQASVFHIDAAFMAKAKEHGFTDMSLDKLVKLKITGLLD
jgi:beta-lactamase regulating signal transducer with metallopeptidase domain